MGRKALNATKCIDDEAKRIAVSKKRKPGLLKKACEYSAMIGQPVTVKFADEPPTHYVNGVAAPIPEETSPAKRPKTSTEEKFSWDDEMEEEYIDIQGKDVVVYERVLCTIDEVTLLPRFDTERKIYAIPQAHWGSTTVLKSFATPQQLMNYVLLHVHNANKLAALCETLEPYWIEILGQTSTLRFRGHGIVAHLPVYPCLASEFEH